MDPKSWSTTPVDKNNNRQLRLLVVDDDEMVGRTVAAMARRDGHEVRTTTSAEAFLDAVDDWQPEVVAIDLVLPDIDGVQILNELAARAFTASIVIMSGVGQRVLEAARRSAREHSLNIVGILPKPFSHDQLTRLLDESAAFLLEASGRPSAGNGEDAAIDVADVRHALTERQLTVFYQPKVSSGDLQLAGFEALVRWLHPTMGIVPAARFVTLAEQSDLIDELTEFVVDEALGWFATLRDCDRFRELHLSLNLSARLLESEAWLDRLVPRCGELGIEPPQLCFELTETAAMADPTASLDLLTRLRVKGFRLSVDDFGTGYSSMQQLARLPFSEIKIDKSFVMSAEESAESQQVIKSITELGRGLGIDTCAEGVESEWTIEFLRSLGCNYLQGFHFAKPAPGDEVRRVWAL
jgi:EAL domain-containing protein (putative c-di-GMP-specific phosphodiesterase class I)/ActR/RegA family two-component response regulator